MKRRAAFFVFLAIILVLSLVMVRRWLIPLLLGAAIGYLLLPFYDWLGKHIKSETKRSMLVVVIVGLVIALPMLAFITELARQLPKAAEAIDFRSWIEHLSRWSSARLGRPIAIGENLQSWLTSVKDQLLHSVSGIAGVVGSTTLSALVMLYTLFYALRDGRRIWANVLLILPLSESVKPLLAANLQQTLRGVLYGQFFTAVALGGVCAVAYSLFHVSHVLLWSFLTVIMAMIPMIGPVIVWLPLAFSRLVLNDLSGFLGLFFVCGSAALIIDNILKPRYIGSHSQLHPLAALVGVLGGLEFFGLIGFLFGPILLGLLMAMLRFYQEVEVLRGPIVPPPGAPPPEKVA